MSTTGAGPQKPNLADLDISEISDALLGRLLRRAGSEGPSCCSDSNCSNGASALDEAVNPQP